jgi:sigma-E factor negative regulatory protein RseA
MKDADTPDAFEGLSALVDGEVDARTGAALSAAWRDDAAVRARWHRYHLIGDVLRSEELGGSGGDAAFLARLRERLAEEPVVLAPSPQAPHEPAQPAVVVGSDVRVRSARRLVRRWAPPAALAAGFMVVAVGTVTLLRPASEPVAPALAAVPAPVPAVRLVAEGGSEPRSFAGQSAPVTLAGDADAPAGLLIRDARLDAYLAAHKQFGGSSALGLPSGFLRAATREGDGPGSR